MAVGTSVVKPFSAAWRARGYFIFALIFWVLHSTISQPFASAASKSWWQDLLDKAVGSFDKIAYLVAVAGLVYVVISDVLEYVWLNNLQGEMEKGLAGVRSDLNSGLAETGGIFKSSLTEFTSSLVGMTFESVKVWVESGKGEPPQIRSVAQSALVNYYGDHNLEADSFVSFSLDDMLDRWASANSQTWEGFTSSVTIRACNVPGHFEWQENRNYTVVCPSKTGKLPFRLEGSSQVNADVFEALDRMEFRVRFGNDVVVDFKDWWLANKPASVPTGGAFKLEADGIMVEFDGVWLRYEASKECKISQNRTPVFIYERSLISSEDRCYALAVRHPTKGVLSNFALELPDWIVKPPVASAELYQKEGRAVRIEQFHRQSCSANLPGWTLPGVAILIEWSPN
ncbi:hypothetical protein J4G43_002340 [Bradyrhizobium barranii subsp. barranii]|uniref:Uncharacterized protein n=1 Tax=Bradyrhizobium barranii subsp. barranii TaxID=2823807 RepID=A0A939M5Y2_9BRAD|nr:hypothetical protein [Bradyrhizobium barranii]UEM13215.1 hypothetical protein J4G43_002340 [Bradyrhizobium barranii subsp. barranii]